MDLCHLKNSELEPTFQKYKGRVVLRGDSVKDDSGSYAVFTEQGSSASQMTAAKVIDIISRLPGCAGQAADAVSSFHIGQNGKTHRRYCKFQSQNAQIFGYVDTQVAKIMVQRGTSGRSFRAKSVQSSFGRTVLGKAEKVPNWECPFANR